MWGEKRVCPLNLTTGSSHLGSKNVKSGVCSSWQWVFYISVEEFLPTLLLQNCFNSAILQGFQTWMACLSSAKESQRHLCHFWLGHSKTSILFLFFWVIQRWTGVLWIIVLLHNWGIFFLEFQNFPIPSHYLHVWPLVWCCFYKMMC